MTHSLWQTESWELFQRHLGNKTMRLGKVLFIEYPLFFGKGYAYAPRGNPGQEQVDELKNNNPQLIFLRIDPATESTLKGKKSHSPQPDTTLILDLSMSEEKLLREMKRKGRYNISLAEKKGVKVLRAQSAEEKSDFVHTFYELLQVTTGRDAFSGHDEKYYQLFLQCIPHAEIFVAYHEGKPLASAIMVYEKDLCIYYYGASGSEHRELMAPYLIQWEAIRDAKQRGCKEYDFLGIAEEGAKADHPWRGITDFKLKFGGTVRKYPRSKDIVFRPVWYKIFVGFKCLQKWIKASPFR